MGHRIRSSRTLQTYELLAPIGSGGFGEVFRARAIDLGILVAVKRFKKGAGSTRDVVDNWAKECVLHQGISHPNVLRAHDAFVERGQAYLVTELATDSLDKLCVAGVRTSLPRTQRMVRRAGLHLSSALHFIHVGWRKSKPVVHRDVTPKNVFYFEKTSMFKLGDFGISKRLGEPDEVATTQIANWHFVSVDLIREGFTVPQSDLFQLGLVLYSILARRPLIPTNATRDQALAAIEGGAAHRAISALTGLNPLLYRVLRRLVIRDRAKRYGTAKEVHDDLSKIAR